MDASDWNVDGSWVTSSTKPKGHASQQPMYILGVQWWFKRKHSKLKLLSNTTCYPIPSQLPYLNSAVVKIRRKLFSAVRSADGRANYYRFLRKSSIAQFFFYTVAGVMHSLHRVYGRHAGWNCTLGRDITQASTRPKDMHVLPIRLLCE